MALAVVPTDKRIIIHYYSASIGSAIIFILTLIISIHVLFHYYRKFHSSAPTNRQKEESKSKIPYLLFILMCFSGLISVTSYAIIKSSLFINTTQYPFTIFRCKLGYLLTFIPIYIMSASAYVLFVYRIQTVFEGTQYQYPLHIIKYLYTSLIILFILLTICLIISSRTTYFALFVFGTNNQHQNTYCATNGALTLHVNMIAVGLFFSMHCGFGFILLYMFTKKLYALQVDTLSQYLKEKSQRALFRMQIEPDFCHNIENKSPLSTPRSSVMHLSPPVSPAAIRTSEHNKVPSISSISTTVMEMEVMDISTMSENEDDEKYEHTRKRTMTVDEVKKETEKDESNQLKMVLKLHKLIKKQTILVYVAIMTGAIWLVCVVAVDSWIWNELNWVIFVNTVCNWLMFAESKAYWKFLHKYCCCYLCYCRQNRDLGERSRCIFC